MKKTILSLLFAAVCGFTTMAQKAPATKSPAPAPSASGIQNGPQMKFETIDLDYGTIKQDAEPNRTFKFTNTGNEPLTITNAQGSCGCTVPTWPKEPIMPGATAEINVRYDTHRVGQFTKYITLTTNAPGQDTFRLTIHGTVEQAPDATPVPTEKKEDPAPKPASKKS